MHVDRKLQCTIMALALLAGSLVAALAAKLDKTACNELSTELAGIVASGVRADMGRGPDWAQSNLPPERLRSIKRLLEVEEQLEFRCGAGRGKALAVTPAKPPAKSAGESEGKKPHGPAKTNKSDQETNSTRMVAASAAAPASHAVNDPGRIDETRLPRNPAPAVAAAPGITRPPVIAAVRPEPPAAVLPLQTQVEKRPQTLDQARVASPQESPVRRFNAAKLAVIAALPPQPLPEQGDSTISLDMKAAALSALRPRVTGPRRKAAPRRETTYVSPRDVFMSTYGTSR
jgi:hypothetical protein